jgi:tetratricopeptide (TPR) repeat protein
MGAHDRVTDAGSLPLGWRRELQRGAAALRNGDGAHARDCFARAHALAPDEPEPALALGREEWKRGRLADAEHLLRQAWDARPTWPLAAAALARVLVERGAHAAAEQVLAPAFAASPADPALLLVQGELHVDADRPDEATASFVAARAAGADRKVVELGLARAENVRGIQLSDAGLTTEAAFAFKRACDLDARWAPPRVNLGALLQRMGKRASARAQYQRAVTLDPRNGVAHFNLGLLARDEGDLPEAARAFAEALAADPPHAHARRELALAHAERGDFARAIALFEEELRGPRRPDASTYANLGLAYAKSGERALAEASFRQALKLDDRHPNALANLAALLAGDGRYLEAAALVRRAREAGNSAPPPASK